MKRRTILLIDSDRSSRRRRVVMLLTHGYAVHAVEKLEDLELPLTQPEPDLVLLRADQPPDRSDGAYVAIRNGSPGQRIGFLLDDGHELCQLVVNGEVIRPREQLGGDLIEAVATMFKTEFGAAAQYVTIGR